MTKKNNSIKLY